MSHLTSETKVVYVAVLYDKFGNQVNEGGDRDIIDGALADGEEMVAEAVEITNQYHYAEIKIKVLPRYL